MILPGKELKKPVFTYFGDSEAESENSSSVSGSPGRESSYPASVLKKPSMPLFVIKYGVFTTIFNSPKSAHFFAGESRYL